MGVDDGWFNATTRDGEGASNNNNNKRMSREKEEGNGASAL
jgi:hypothetical protein